MNKFIAVAALCAVCCTATVMLTQCQSVNGKTPSEPSFNRHLPIPPALALKSRAINEQRYALDNAAEAAQEAGNHAEAEANARQAVSLTRGDDEGQELLAGALDAQGKTQEALQAYKVLADEGNQNPRDLLPYAQLLLKTGHWAEAVEAYNRQLPYSSSSAGLIQMYSIFSPDVPRLTDLATAIHIGLGQDLGWRGYHGTYQEKAQQAQGEFQKALALEPASSLANYYMGYGLKRLGKQAEAQMAFRKAAALGTGDVKAAAQKELPLSVPPR